MSLAPGVRLGAYEVLQLIGAGGMGEVYQARDTRLDRIVAIKVLPEHFAADADRRARFEREARAVAALNHPHICDLHDIGEAQSPNRPASSPESIRFLVMEHLEGQTLADRLVGGPLPIADMLRHSVEIADALDHAHRRGLIHRDLKPANVMLTGTGAKLLDFGLSKVLPKPDVPSLETASLDDVPLTAGMALMGTFPYMSPEQLEGREADPRSDIFAFGAIVHEMATGRRAFEGTSSATLIGAILHTDPPPVSALQPLAPSALDRIVARCLAKNPDDRWQTARDLTLELKWITESNTRPLARRQRHHAKLSLVASLVLAGLAISVAVLTWYRRAAPADDSVIQLPFSPPDGLTMSDVASGGSVTISPDGQRLVFVAKGPDGKQLLWVRPLESLDAQALPDTDGAAYPFWSPDSQFIGFFAQRKLMKIQASGGPPQTLCDAIQPRGGTWSAKGVILFSAGAGHELHRIAAGGGVATPVPADGVNQERYWPAFLPDGRHFVYFARPKKHGIYLAALDAPEAKELLHDYVSVAYSPAGYLLVLMGSSRGAPRGTLMAQPFDAASRQLTGDPRPIAEQVAYASGPGRGAFSVSDNGTLVYRTSERRSTQLMWFDRSGKPLEPVSGSAGYRRPSLSPDGKTIAAALVDPVTGDEDLWLIETTRNTTLRFTSFGNLNFLPVWSPDGTRIAFAGTRGAPPNLYLKPATGAGSEEPLVKSTFNSQPTDWSPNGQFILYASQDPKTQWDLWLLPAPGTGTERKPIPFLQTQYNEHLARFSPDGRWVAYASDESGTMEVYVGKFPASDFKRRISNNGGTDPRWRGDGKELFYRAANGRLMVVAVTNGANLEGGAPAVILNTRIDPSSQMSASYAVTRDGERFLIDAVTEEPSSVPTKIMLNWPAALNRR